MPIESIEFAKKTEINQNTNFLTKVGLSATAFVASMALYGDVAGSIEKAKLRSAPSGDTCAEKVGYYARQGAIYDKVRPSDCKNRSQVGRNITEIENAGRYFDYNPIGGVAVAACESGLTEKARNHSSSKASGLFQQLPSYWYGRVKKTQNYINFHTDSRSRPTKLSTNIFNPRANSFTSVYMLSRNGGASNWSPSRHCWGSKYDEVAGSKRHLSSWFATSPKKKLTK